MPSELQSDAEDGGGRHGNQHPFDLSELALHASQMRDDLLGDVIVHRLMPFLRSRTPDPVHKGGQGRADHGANNGRIKVSNEHQAQATDPRSRIMPLEEQEHGGADKGPERDVGLFGHGLSFQDFRLYLA
jgi:hypothetical protein